MADTLVSRNISPSRAEPRAMQGKKSSKKTPRRPVTPGKNKKSGHDQWMIALKKRQALTLSNTYRTPSPRHKSTTEFFVDTLRKTGVGLSSETNKSQSLTGLDVVNGKHYPYMSTSHFLRQKMGTEKTQRVDDPTSRPSAGTPNYKSQEEYYEEVQYLRRQIAALNQDASISKTRIRRLEEDNAKKKKEIDALLDPGKNGELRRTLGDRQADASAVVHSLKQKILKLELQLRDREAAFCKLQADLKTTKIEEMRTRIDQLYAEVLRLQMSKDTGVDKTKSGSSPTKVKALSETVIRLSRSNDQLQAENKALRDDLNNALQANEAKPDLNKEFADMNRTELLMTLSKMEKRLEKAESRADGDGWSVHSQETAKKTQGKIELDGSLEDRLQQLDNRETELLDEVHRLKNLLRRHKEDKKKSEEGSLPPTPRRRQSAYRDDGQGSRPQSGRKSLRGDEGSRPSSSKSREGKGESFQQRPSATISLQQEMERRNQAALKIQSAWKTQQREKHRRNEAATKIQSAWKTKQTEKHRRNQAALKIQSAWKTQQQEKYKRNQAALKIQSTWKTKQWEKQVEQFRQKHAAKTIQNKWFGYKQRRYDEDLDDAAYTIQGAMKGFHLRKQRMHDWDPEESDLSSTDEGVNLIQSSLRGHHNRSQQMKNWRNQYSDDDADSVLSSSYGRRRSSPPGRPGSGSRLSLSGSRPGSAGQHGSRPGTGQRPSSGHRPSSASKRGSVSHTFKARYDVPSPTLGDGDDDDDIMFAT